MNDRLKPFLAQLKDAKIPPAGIVRMANGGANKSLPPVTEADVKAARAELAKAAEDVAKVADDVVEGAGIVAEVAEVVGDAAEALAKADTPAEAVGAVVEAVTDLVALAGSEAEKPEAPAVDEHRERLEKCKAMLEFIADTKLRDTDRGPLAARIRQVQALLAAPVPAQPKRDEAVEDDGSDPPSHVRVKAGGHRTFPRGPNGRPFPVAFRDVHKGPEAAWLWKNHRALVEPFDPTPKLPRK